MRIPTLSGRYKLESTLGEGGMAVVLRAYDKRLQVERAVKVLRTHLSMHTQIRSRFESEASTMAKLHHRNIVTIYDIANHEQLVYIVMELLPGGSLMGRVEKHGVLHPQLAITATIDMCKALAHAHKHNVIHRDVKPHNVLISEKGVIKMTDFGIARIDDGESSFTRTGAIMGTVAYMSPEQRINAKRASVASDVYAAAASFYVLLTNERPLEIFIPKVQEKIFASLDPEIAAFLVKGCHASAEKRFSSADEMIIALQQLSTKLPQLKGDEKPLFISEVVEKEPPKENISKIQTFFRDYQQNVANATPAFHFEDDNQTIGLEQFEEKKEEKDPDVTPDFGLFDEVTETSRQEGNEASKPERKTPVGTPKVMKPAKEKAKKKPKSEPVDAVSRRTPAAPQQTDKQNDIVEPAKKPYEVAKESSMTAKATSRTDRGRPTSAQELDNAEDERSFYITGKPRHRKKTNDGPIPSPAKELKRPIPWATLLLIGFVLCTGLLVVFVQKQGKIETELGIGIDLILIPEGEFGMGGFDIDSRQDEKPVHSVQISRSFYLSKSEITQQQWQNIMQKNPSTHRNCPSCPVDSITWRQALEFANALSRKAKLEVCYNLLPNHLVEWPKGLQCTGYRLPTEAEWEFAARGEGKRSKFAGGDSLVKVAWFQENADGTTHPVCKKQKNSYALCDMSGNVAEWVWDWYGDYTVKENVDPIGPAFGKYRVLRGGSFMGDAFQLRTSFRFNLLDPKSSRKDIGFRVARSISRNKK